MSTRPRPPKPYEASRAAGADVSNTAATVAPASARLKPWEREAVNGTGAGSLVRSAASSASAGSTTSPLSSDVESVGDTARSSVPSARGRVGYSSHPSSAYDDRNEYGSGSYGYGSSSSYGGGYGGDSYGRGYGGGSGYDRYGSGGYGGYSGYGGYGGGYRSRYDPYNSGYGDAYGDYYGKFGGYDRPGMGRMGPWRAIDQGFHWMHDLQSVTDGFGRFASILDSNSQAMHGMLSSIVRLIENIGLLYKEIGVFVSGFALIRFLARFFRRLFGKPPPEVGPATSADVAEFAGDSAQGLARGQRSRSQHAGASSSWSGFLATMAVVFLGVPALVALFRRASRAVKEVELGEARQKAEGRPVARALFDYTPQSEAELALATGDLIIVLQQPTEDWWEGEVHTRPGQIGLFPANYVRLEPPVAEFNSGDRPVEDFQRMDARFPPDRRRPLYPDSF